MMMPAEEHPVVRMRRTASRMLMNVMDFTPTRTDMAAGDDASTIAERDREPLMVVEHAI